MMILQYNDLEYLPNIKYKLFLNIKHIINR